MKKVILFITLFLGIVSAKDTVNVVVHEMAPMVMEDENGNLTGFDIDAFNKVAEELNVVPNYKIVPAFTDIFQYIDDGHADFGIAGITITHARAEKYDFSYPYKKSGLSILIRDEYEMNTTDAILTVVTNDSFLTTWGIFLIFVIVMANIIWFTERGSESIPDKYKEGFEVAIWYMFVVVTTVGFGDVVVKKRLSKLITVATFFLGIGLAGTAISQLNAVFDAQMETYAINNVDELRGKQVAVVGGTTSELDNTGAKIVKAKTSDEAVLLLEARRVDAVVFDAPTLQYYAKENEAFTTVGGMFNLQDYGIVMKKGHAMRDSVSMKVLQLIESDVYDNAQIKWFGKND